MLNPVTGAGMGYSSITGFSSPHGLALSDNTLYVSDFNGGSGNVGDVEAFNATTGVPDSGFNTITDADGADAPAYLAVLPVPEPSPRAMALPGLGLTACVWRLRRAGQTSKL